MAVYDYGKILIFNTYQREDYGEILSFTTTEPIFETTFDINNIDFIGQNWLFDEDVLYEWNNNWNYGTYNNIVGNDELKLSKTKEINVDYISEYDTTQEGYSYGYGYEIEVVEDTVLDDVGVMYSLPQGDEYIKVCIFEQNGSTWNKITEKEQFQTQVTEETCWVTDLNTLLLAGNTYRIIHYSEFGRDLHWSNQNIHPETISFGSTVKSIGDASKYKAEGNFSEYYDKNVVMKINTSGVYKQTGNYQSDWQWQGYNPIYDNIKTIANLMNNVSGTLTIESSDDKNNVLNTLTFDLGRGTHGYDISTLTGQYLRVKFDLNTNDIKYSPSVDRLSIYGTSEPYGLGQFDINNIEFVVATNPTVVGFDMSNIEFNAVIEANNINTERSIDVNINTIEFETNSKQATKTLDFQMNNIVFEGSTERISTIITSIFDINPIEFEISKNAIKNLNFDINDILFENNITHAKRTIFDINEIIFEGIRDRVGSFEIQDIEFTVATNPTIIPIEINQIEFEATRDRISNFDIEIIFEVEVIHAKRAEFEIPLDFLISKSVVKNIDFEIDNIEFDNSKSASRNFNFEIDNINFDSRKISAIKRFDFDIPLEFESYRVGSGFRTSIIDIFGIDFENIEIIKSFRAPIDPKTITIIEMTLTEREDYQTTLYDKSSNYIDLKENEYKITGIIPTHKLRG